VLISVSKEGSPRVTLLINPAVGGHYFLSGMRYLPSVSYVSLINRASAVELLIIDEKYVLLKIKKR